MSTAWSAPRTASRPTLIAVASRMTPKSRKVHEKVAMSPAPVSYTHLDVYKRQALHREWSLTATAAGLVAAIVSYAGPFAVVLQATHAAGLDAGHTASWVWALAIGSGVSGIVLSLATRMPVIVAWSTPGAALLLASIGGYRFSDAVGAFLLASLAATVLGVTGWFGKLSLIHICSARPVSRPPTDAATAGVAPAAGVESPVLAATPGLNAGAVQSELVSAPATEPGPERQSVVRPEIVAFADFGVCLLYTSRCV